jgi:hypothetical protein
MRRKKKGRVHTGDNVRILRVSKKLLSKLFRAPKKNCMQLVSKVSFFFRRIYALASLERQIFLLVKKVFYSTRLLHKQLFFAKKCAVVRNFLLKKLRS